MFMCRVFSCVVGRGYLLWPVCSLGKTLLAFAVLHSILQGPICLLVQVFLDFLLLHLSEFAQIHVHWVDDAKHLILCYPLLLLPSQLFSSGGQNIGVSASVLLTNTQGWFPLGLTGWISLQSKGLSRVFANITVQKHQFFGAQLSSQSNSHIHTWPLEKP